MSLVSPLTETLRGLRGYLRGLNWLRTHPRYLAWLMLPITVAFFFFVGGLGALLAYGSDLVQWALFAKPDAWWALPIYYLCAALLYFGVVVLLLLGTMLVMNVAAAPVYELVSVAVERSVTGQPPPQLGFWQNVRVIWIELKKMIFIFAVTVVLFVIPGVNLFAVFVTAFLVGWSFYDFPLARRGWGFRERLRFVMREFFAVMGFGLWLMIPFVQFALVPLAIAGGTLLNLDALREQRLLNQR